MKKLVMTGGGTGGHIIPNLALIPELKKNFKIYYLGEENSMEQELVSKDKDITFVPIKAVKFNRKFDLSNLLIPFKLLKYISETKKILKKIKPNVIFCKGGYVSIPVAYAGKKLRIPILAHESDFSIGLANKLILKKAEVLFTSFRETCVSNKCLYSGSPLRKEIFYGKKETAEKMCNFKKKQTVLMFFGGSLGSKNINNFVFENISKFKDYNIIHFVGKKNAKIIDLPNYFQIEFSPKIYDFFELADIIICRAGSNSIFELLALQKLMILVPLSKKQSRGDQIENADVFRKNGYAQVLEEQNLTFQNLNKKINNAIKNEEYYKKNMVDADNLSANKTICDYLIKFAK